MDLGEALETPLVHAMGRPRPGVAGAVRTLRRLDTGDRMAEAIGMYASFGFVEAAPHHVHPDDLRPYMVFMELPLFGAAKT